MKGLITLCGGAALALTLAIGVTGQTPPTVKRTMLGQTDLSVPGREVVQAVAEIPPTGSTGRHTHFGEEVSYVMEGELLLEVEGKPSRTVKAGEAFVVPYGVIHDGRNVGTVPVKVVVAYVVEKGKPVTTPVK